ncbi:hypothetical protein [Lysobacter capsici]|uniref:hypothetical protein n=1 Tax=Lysobacter capsici TaxID=435897 RepID=UPI001BFFF979|nr:hypothetical protein [Lysobacter capsici]QWF15485.1 hypothetical protein KME82_17060 [Lysobacter capsici]
MNAKLVKWSLSAALVLAVSPALAAAPPACKSLPKDVAKMIQSFDSCARAENPTVACEKLKLNARVYENDKGLLPPLGPIGPKYWRAAPALLGSPQGLVYLVQESAKGRPITQRYYTHDSFGSFCTIKK